MSGQIVSEGRFLLYCLPSGICITIVYDCLRIFRRVKKHSTGFVALEDLVFWFAAAAFLFYMLYETNNGIIRWFSIVGAGVGMKKQLKKKLTGDIKEVKITLCKHKKQKDKRDSHEP